MSVIPPPNPLPAELAAIRDTVTRLFDTTVMPAIRGYEERREFPRPLVRAMGEAGLFGAAFPEEVGGTDLGFMAGPLIPRGINRAPPRLRHPRNLQAMTCPFTILNWGSEDQARRFVPPLIAGEKIGAFMLTEPGGGSDPAGSMKTRAVRDGDVYRVSGSKQWITFAHAADTAVLHCFEPLTR